MENRFSEISTARKKETSSAGSRQDPFFTPPAYDSLLLDSGRSALFLGLKALRRSGCAPVIHLPAVICRAVIAICRLQGFSLRFYGQGKDLKTPTFAQTPLPEEVVLYVHYFGGRHGVMEDFLTSLPRRPFVVEDGTAAGLTPGVGTFGDVAVRGFRKLLPIPDGAQLLSRVPLDVPREAPDETFLERKRRELSHPFSLLPPDPFGAEARLDQWIAPRDMSSDSQAYLASGLWRPAAAARRAAHRHLSELRALLGNPLLEELPLLPEDAVPLGYPLLLHRSYGGELRRRLRREGFTLPMDWGLPPDAPWKDDGEFLRHLVVLPVTSRASGDEERLMALATEVVACGTREAPGRREARDTRR